MKQEAKRGGARSGSGRKNLGRNIPKTFKFSEEELKKMKENMEKNEVKSMNEFVIRQCCG